MRRRSAPIAWRALVVRHLFGYLAVLAGLVVAVSVVLAREELGVALREIDLRWVPVVLGLSLFNYALRFWKWHRLLLDAGVSVPITQNAQLYFACLAMVVTPARLGELYKLVFLRKLHGVSPARALPPLVMERVTDALAVLALVAAGWSTGIASLAAVAGVVSLLVGLGAMLGLPRWQGWLMMAVHRIGPLQRRASTIERGLEGHAALLRPRSLGPSLVLSTVSWWAECVGLWVLCRSMQEMLGLSTATWIYALSTLLGNLTFLPGGLGGTEVSLFALVRNAGVSTEGAIAATALIRAATLWFAVAIGLTVTLVFRRRLRWKEITEEAAQASGSDT